MRKKILKNINYIKAFLLLTPTFLFSLIILTGAARIETEDCDGVTSIHVWEPVEITLTSAKTYGNPYADVEVWVQLQGPGFNKKVHGFWDGGNTFKVRLIGTSVGTWTWTSGSNQSDSGLNGKTGSFETIAWTEAEKNANPNRRGLVQVTASGHALEYADGSPFMLMADTHWSATTARYPWKGKEPDPNYVPKSGLGFEETIQWLKKQGINSIALIACFPNWREGTGEARIQDSAGIWIRRSWSPDKRYDEDGNMPFKFPGKCKGVTEACADYDRINPPYWKNMDKKMKYMWENGFIPNVESVRRDHFPTWFHYYDFNESFSRYLLYLRARYGCYNIFLSLVHFDGTSLSGQMSYKDVINAIDYYYSKYGPMPFGQPTTCMCGGSTLTNIDHERTKTWLKIHTASNIRDRRSYPNMRDMYNHPNPYVPVFNCEPYYAGWIGNYKILNGEKPKNGSLRDSYFARTHGWGNQFNGGVMGHVYGSDCWAGASTGQKADGDHVHIWTALTERPCLGQMQYISKFLLSEGNTYKDLKIAGDALSPQFSPARLSDNLDGEAHMLLTSDKRIAFIYFENKCNQATVNNLQANKTYKAQWFNPRTGAWTSAGTLTTDGSGKVKLPTFPGGKTQTSNNEDWAIKLKL